MSENKPNLSPLKALLEASANSPLSEADPRSLNELMARAQSAFNINAEEISDEEIATIVAYFQSKRGKFAQLAALKEVENKNKPKRTASTSVAEAMERATGEIEL